MGSIPSRQPAPPVPRHLSRRMVEGFRVPEDHPLTRNERGWVELLRLLAGDADPPPSLPAIQALRAVLPSG